MTVAASSKDHYLLFTYLKLFQIRYNFFKLLWSYKFFKMFVAHGAWYQTAPLQSLVRSYAIQVCPLSPLLLGFVDIGSYAGFPEYQHP